MQKFWITLTIVGFILFLIQVIFMLDHADPSWQNNHAAYLGMITALLLVLNGFYSYFYMRKQNQSSAI